MGTQETRAATAGTLYRVVATFKHGRVETIETSDRKHARAMARSWSNRPGFSRPESVKIEDVEASEPVFADLDFADCDDSGAQDHTIPVDLGDAYDMLCDAIAKLASGFGFRLEVA